MDFDLLRIALLATFLLQLLTGSVIAPRRIYLWRRELWEKYPPDQYPRLYPIGTDRVKRLQSVTNIVDGAVFCGGALIFFVVLTGVAETGRIAFFISVLAMVQIFVRLPRSIIDRQIIRAYKTAQPPSVRSATFKNWTLGDFVSPAIVVLGMAVTAMGLCVAIVVALWQQGGARLTPTIAIMMSMNAFLLFRMIRAIFQPLLPRIDPYASNDDVYLSRRRRLRILFIGSAIFAVVTSIELLATTELLEIRYEYIMIGLSALIQTGWLLISTVVLRQLRARDLSAYRGPAEPSGPDSLVRP